MSDKRTIAIILGATIGVAAVATAVGIYVARHNQDAPEKSVNEIFDEARRTVEQLDKTLGALRKTAS